MHNSSNLYVDIFTDIYYIKYIYYILLYNIYYIKYKYIYY